MQEDGIREQSREVLSRVALLNNTVGVFLGLERGELKEGERTWQSPLDETATNLYSTLCLLGEVIGNFQLIEDKVLGQPELKPEATDRKRGDRCTL